MSLLKREFNFLKNCKKGSFSTALRLKNFVKIGRFFKKRKIPDPRQFDCTNLKKCSKNMHETLSTNSKNVFPVDKLAGKHGSCLSFKKCSFWTFEQFLRWRFDRINFSCLLPNRQANFEINWKNRYDFPTKNYDRLFCWLPGIIGNYREQPIGEAIRNIEQGFLLMRR